MHSRVHCARSFPSLWCARRSGRCSVKVSSRPGREQSHTASRARGAFRWLSLAVTGWLGLSPAAEIGAHHPATLNFEAGFLGKAYPARAWPSLSEVPTRDLDHVIPLNPNDMPLDS